MVLNIVAVFVVPATITIIIIIIIIIIITAITTTSTYIIDTECCSYKIKYIVLKVDLKSSRNNSMQLQFAI